MEKLFISLVIGAMCALPTYVYAEGSQARQGIQQQDRDQDQTNRTVTDVPRGNQNQNQNDVDSDEDSGQQDESASVDSVVVEDEMGTSNGSDNGRGYGAGVQNQYGSAGEHMSRVAEQVQQMLQAGPAGGIGEQVREIAREQNQVQNRIQEQLNRLDAKGMLARFLTGTDFGAVEEIKSHIAGNQERINQLEQLQNQLFNDGDATMVRETVQALVRENAALQERVQSEEQVNGLFGWVFRFFRK